MTVRHSRSRRTVALIASATVAGSGVALTAPSIANAAPTACASTFALFIPGTWETDENADPNQPVGMLKPVADALKTAHGSQAEVYTLPYMARAFDYGHTYADSKADAVSPVHTIPKDSSIQFPHPQTFLDVNGPSRRVRASLRKRGDPPAHRR